MKLSIPLLFITVMMPLLPAHAATETKTISWLTNYEEAVNQSKAKSVPLLMFFTGSDWCSWCNRLEREVLDTSEFAHAAGDKFVFLKLDFPLYTNIPTQTSEQNKQLQKKYAVRSFPTIILLDTQQLKTMGTTGYRAGGAKSFAQHLLKMVSEYSSYKQKVSQVDQQKFSGSELKQLYEKAKELDFYADVNQIIKVGMNSDEKIYFQLERYRFLVEEGSARDPEAMSLRQQLLAADPKNERKLPYQIAVIDFESFSEDLEKESTPEMAVSPLVSYIEKFGSEDRDNLWRLEMIISQVYLDHNKISQALQYAQFSHDAAPATVQPEIAKAIRNIQGQPNSLHSPF